MPDAKSSARKSSAERSASPKKSSKSSAVKSTRKSSAAVYTDPELRDKIKSEIQAGDKGGDAGEWSARKSQMLAVAYKKAGGGYKKRKTEAQERLDQWSGEKWTTRDGKAARRDGETARLLPEKAWEDMTPAERKATDAKKRSGSRQGKQVVPNTKAAKRARKKATS